ncbi:hypothetical protein Emtol_3696 [Emticicia oligotrophica DSM 17448]|uniref:Outer membrane protein transport protein (OMPP1/FadL/TodX) n=1 Tax=Emticicia oligotrophica (strain DSM 17448 / CIP 109782 / MTCC 6937 / GPTSA100-15) TaxID=929562 RepID=A0ABM5N5R7_EMTOG|nr:MULTISPECIES: hypothetical protein [Emticicia]AFK04822.1 hypothetical protein Emtol_3696 [Emticicia oligotrophica DSM 17448]
MLKKINLTAYLIISLLGINQTFAQKESRLYGNSPYSALGIGDIYSGSAIANEAMGGTGLSFSNGIIINTINPALLAKNRYVAFNTGLRGQYKTLSNGTLSQTDFGMNLSHITLAFPVKTKWTTAISLQPYSGVEHEARITQTITGSDQTVSQTYKGLGGLSKAAWSNGFLVGKKLYLGVETGFYFGSFRRDTTTKLLVAADDVFLRYSDRMSVGGFALKTGFAFQQKLTDKWNLNVGGTYELQSKLNGDRIRTFSTLYDSGNGPALIKKVDTLGISTGGMTLPSRYALGISLESPYKWVFSAEYSRQDWTKYLTFDGRTDKNLTKSERIAFGVEYLPKYTSTKYFNQVFYRAGFQQIKTPYLVNGTQITDNSFSLGLSTPLAYRSVSYIDLALAVGNRGVSGAGLVKENYIKISLGFSLMDTRWFLKPKID